MTRHRLRPPATLLATLAVLVVALLAATGTAAGAPGAPTDGAAVASTAVAQDASDTKWLNVTLVYERAPDREGEVLVTYVVENTDVVDRADVDEVVLDYSSFASCRGGCTDEDYGVVSKTGFEDAGDGAVAVTSDNDTATLTFYDDLENGRWDDTIAVRDGTVTQLFPDHVLGDQEVEIQAETQGDTEVRPAYTYDTAGPGFVTSGNSEEVARITSRYSSTPYYPMVVMGDYTMHNATVDGRTVHLVVPDGVQLRESPDTTAQVLAEMAAEFDAGQYAGPRYVLAHASVAPDLGEVVGYTRSERARWAEVQANQPVFATWSTWAEELAHTTDRMDFDTIQGTETSPPDDMASWFHEPYAVHQAITASMEAGYGSYGDYRAQLEYGTRLDQYDHSSSGDGRAHRDYYYGALVMHRLDYELRTHSDGEHSVEDFFEAVETYDGRVNTSAVEQIARNLADDTVANQLNDWVYQNAAPEPLTLSEYQQTVGSVPNVSTNVTSIEVTSDRGTEVVQTDEPLAVRRGSTVEFEVEVVNTGDAAGHYKPEVRDADSNPLLGDPPAVHDEAVGTVPANSVETVTLSHTFAEQGTHQIDVGEVVPTNTTPVIDGEQLADPYNVTVVEEDATIVREHGHHTDIDHGAIVGPDTSSVVYQADQPGSGVYTARNEWYDTGSDGVYTFDDPSSLVAPGQRKTTRFSYYGDAYYVSSLPAVENDQIPTDPDGDGLYEDLSTDGHVSHGDISIMYTAVQNDDSDVTGYVDAYDFDGDDDVDMEDVNALADELV